MKPWERDKAWSDQFIPSVCTIVGPKLLVQSSLEVDRSQAGNLVLLQAGNDHRRTRFVSLVTCKIMDTR